MRESLYHTSDWKSVAAQAKARDGHRCTVARLLGGICTDRLDAHHLIPVEEGGEWFDLENIVTACSSHHPTLEALRRRLLTRDRPRVRKCPHRHRTLDARRQCEARLNRLAA